MRKRSKKRIPQDVKPWIKLKELENEIFQLPNKKTTRWVAGGRRDWNTAVLVTAATEEVKQILIKAMVNGLPNNSFSKNLRNKLHHSASNTMQSLPKYKNYCLMSGRGRTYNRFLYMARHNVRKLVGVGAISGLVK